MFFIGSIPAMLVFLISIAAARLEKNMKALDDRKILVVSLTKLFETACQLSL